MKGTPCRRCPARIGFVVMRDSDKLMPVDPIPDELGTVVATRDDFGRWLDGRIVPLGEPIPEKYRRYMPHWATCARPEEKVPAPAIPGPWPPEEPLF